MIQSSLRPVRYAIAGMIAMAVALGIGRFVYTPLLPGMMEELGLSASDAGLIASGNYLGYLLGALVAVGGWAAGLERRLTLAALAANAVLCAAMGLTDHLFMFVAVRFFAGVASAFLMVFLASIVFSHLAAAGRSDLQAVHFAGIGIGVSASGIMTALLVMSGAAWPEGWLWSALLSAVGFVAVFLLLDEGPVVHAGGGIEPPLPRDPRLFRIILAYGLFGLGYVVTTTFLVAIVRQGDGGRIFEAVVWMVTGLAAIPSTFLWNRLASRIGMTTTFAIGSIVEAVGVAISVSVGGIAGPLLAGLLLGGTFAAITAIGLQIGRVLAQNATRRALALMTASFGVGQIVGPLVAGVAADLTGSFTAPSLGAALILVLAGIVAWAAGPVEKLP